MSKPTLSKLLLTPFLTIALAGTPKPAFGQHNGRSSHGGGGSHNSGPRGGGGPRSGGGFHLGRGLFGGKGFGRGLSASPRQRSGGSSRTFGRSGSRPKRNSAYVGGRRGLSNRPPITGLTSRSWSRQRQSSWASLSRSRLFFNPNRRLSDSRNSRFGNSALGHLSFSNSRVGSSVPIFGGSPFAGAQHFDSIADSLNQESSFDGGDFSFIPDLFGLGLNLGGFGLRGLALLGSRLSPAGTGGGQQGTGIRCGTL
jgi:hypothetical protein